MHGYKRVAPRNLSVFNFFSVDKNYLLTMRLTKNLMVKRPTKTKTTPALDERVSTMTIEDSWRSFVEMVYSVILCTLQPATMRSIMETSDIPVVHVGLSCRLPLLQHALYKGSDGGFGAHFHSKDPAIVKAAHDFMDTIRLQARIAIAQNGYRSLTLCIA